MKKYVVAFRFNEHSDARTTSREQIKTFDDKAVATAFVSTLAASGTRDLVSVSRINFETLEVVKLQIQLVKTKLELVEAYEPRKTD